MASTTALYTGLSGLLVNSRSLDVIGNNIANVNTTGFKSNRILFTPIFSRNFSLGTTPNSNTGGTNPTQIGLGASIAGTQRNFNTGSITATGVATDVAIEGDGLFIVSFGGEQFYTRVGSFQRNSSDDLVSIGGARLMGYDVDSNFKIVPGTLVELNIPVGSLTLAEATRNVTFNGNLNASGTVATTGSVHDSRAFYTDAALTTLATSTLDLTVVGNDLYIDDGAGGSLKAFEGGAGTIITIDGIQKGGKDLGIHKFAFSSTAVAGTEDFGTTFNDYLVFLNDVLGLDSSTIGASSLGGIASFASGILSIKGNEGEAQALTIDSANIVASNTGTAISQPFIMSKSTDANGESVLTSYVVFDSLGSPLTVDITFVLQKTIVGQGTVWEFIVESSDNDALDRVIGLGEVTFDGNGAFVSATNQAFTLTRTNGAISPLIVQMEFNSPTNKVSALTNSSSNLASIFQDGSPIGTLSAFSIGETGVISGSFTNGLTRTIGQVAIAKFSNPEGLVDTGNNLFRAGPNSGSAIITEPLSFGTGRMIGGALELSNVDLSQEFINMILASTGYSAAARVITTTDELLDQLLILGR